jgi:Fe(3+) dicitrate transport protein
VAGIEAAVEADAAWLAGSEWSVPVRLSYTLTRAEFGGSFESDFEPWGDVAEGDRLPYLPEHQLSASVGLERGRWDAALAVQAVSEMRTVAGRGEIPAGEGTDAFAIWSASAGYAVTPWASLQAGIENLTDEVYVVARRPAGARPGLPRTFQAGVRLTY